jgi:hypothetical protein
MVGEAMAQASGAMGSGSGEKWKGKVMQGRRSLAAGAVFQRTAARA